MLKYLIILFFFAIDLEANNRIPRSYHSQRQLVQDASNEFEIVVLSQIWPQASCWDLNSLWSEMSNCNRCVLPNTHNNWTLHGLWPSNKHGGNPQRCNRTAKFRMNELNTDIRSQMDAKWTSYRRGKGNSGFWKHEWEKHGTCALELEKTNNLNDYFSHSLSLLDKYNVGKILMDENIIPGNTYEVLEIYYAIHNNLNVNPFIACARNPDKKDEQYLLQVNICFDKTFDLVDCKDKNDISNCSQKKPVIYPENVRACS